jgi:endonuclease/exonuclease/phosphatase (EEP) superfamily protein YafD
MMKSVLKKFIFPVLCAAALFGCEKQRRLEEPAGPHFSVMTYNVNWGGGQPAKSLDVIRKVNADIVCLQETNDSWENYLRRELGSLYPHMEFRETPGRMGGGLAFLSKTKGQQIAYIPSENTFFDGWIMAYQTPVGLVEILNVHLHPPVSESGSFGVSGYFSSQDKRCQEIQRFYPYFTGSGSRLIMGDFNENDQGDAIKWLSGQGMTDALAEFDQSSKTWRWKISLITLRDRLDHVVYSSELYCFGCGVISSGGSDHYPLWGVFGRKNK